MIQVNDYNKAYGDTVAVEGLSFEVVAGSSLGLVGPNGAGKTTTLRAIAGIIPPTRGSLSIAGHDIVRSPIPAKREMAYVPDDPKLFASFCPSVLCLLVLLGLSPPASAGPTLSPRALQLLPGDSESFANGPSAHSAVACSRISPRFSWPGPSAQPLSRLNALTSF